MRIASSGSRFRASTCRPRCSGRTRTCRTCGCPGMLHGRVIRPAPIGATLVERRRIARIADCTGVRVVKRDAFLGVVAPTEWTAIQAMRHLKVTWTGGGLAPVTDLAGRRARRAGDSRKRRSSTPATSRLSAPARINATYRLAVSNARFDRAVVRHRRRARRQSDDLVVDAGHLLLALGAGDAARRCPTAAVRVKYVEGSGCYGHNGSDDAAADAALLSQAVGAPVRVQWMRDQEHGWDPKGPAMVIAHSAALDRRRATHRAPGAATCGRPRIRRARSGDVGQPARRAS